MAHKLKTLVKTSELKTDYIENLSKQGQHSLHLDYDKELDSLMLLFVAPSPDVVTVVHYLDECVALVFKLDTLDIVGLQIEDFKRLFLPKHDGVEKVWSLKVNASELAFGEDVGDLVIYLEKRKQKVAHEIFDATEAILGKSAQQLKDVLEYA